MSSDELVVVSPSEAQARARADWRKSGGTLSGAALGERYGRGARWGRQQIAAARAEDAASVPTAGNGTEDHAALVPEEVERHSAMAPAEGERSEDVPPVLAVITAASVALVALVCAVVSFLHLRDLAMTVGLGGLAIWYPIAIDGMALSSTCSLVADRQRRRRGEPLAKLGLILGIAGSLLGNLADVDPTLFDPQLVRMVLAGAPPVALAIAGHLAFRTLGERK